MMVALYCASMDGRLDIAKALLQNEAQVNIQTKKSSTALHVASMYGHLDIVKALLQNGAQVNIQNNDGETALHWASHHGPAVSSFLVSNGSTNGAGCLRAKVN